jgi:hypothetical protein
MSREKKRKPGIKETGIQKGWNGRAVFPAFNFGPATVFLFIDFPR